MRLAAVRAKTITHARTSTFARMWDPRGRKVRVRVKGRKAKTPVTLPMTNKPKVVAKAENALRRQLLALVHQALESVDA